MEMRVEKGELKIILREIYALKARYQPVSSWPVIWRNLVDFCRSRGFRVSETKDLISRKSALGIIYPQLRTQ